MKKSETEKEKKKHSINPLPIVPIVIVKNSFHTVFSFPFFLFVFKERPPLHFPRLLQMPHSFFLFVRQAPSFSLPLDFVVAVVVVVVVGRHLLLLLLACRSSLPLPVKATSPTIPLLNAAPIGITGATSPTIRRWGTRKWEATPRERWDRR